MSVVTPTMSVEQSPLRHPRPSTLGLVRGELFKARRQVITWIMSVLVLVIVIVPYLFYLAVPHLSDQLHNDPDFFYTTLEIGLTVLRVFSGFFLLIITARMISLEYRLGTIRVLLSRGVGRLQLFFAKLLTMALLALVLLVVGLLLTGLSTFLVVVKAGGGLNSFQALPAQYWSDIGTFILTLLVNTVVTILVAATAAVIGRSSAFGLSVALAFFPLDNIGTGIMQLAYLLTNNDFWLNLTAYFLGPNLNDMPHTLVMKFDALGATPLYLVSSISSSQSVKLQSQTHGTLVDGTHTLVVAAVYALVFAALSIWLVWRRDVQE